MTTSSNCHRLAMMSLLLFVISSSPCHGWTTKAGPRRVASRSPGTARRCTGGGAVPLQPPRFRRALAPLPSPTALASTAAGDSTQAGLSSGGPSAPPSPPVLSVEGLSCTHDGGGTWQLRDVSYNLQRGARVALIGRNGTGKSTLLKILHEAYLDSFPSPTPAAASSTAFSQRREVGYRYTGAVRCPKNVRVSMVDQEPPMPSDVTVGDAILGITTAEAAPMSTSPVPPAQSVRNRNLLDVVRAYRIASQRAEADPDRFAAASADMDAAAGGWDVLTRAEEIATKLRVRHLQDQPLSSLSGGERKRVALCAALVEEPDVLLLDEPTNFLSLAGVDWLAELLTGGGGGSNNRRLTILMVTHDRAFLEEVCDRILELDRGALYEHYGSYSSYLEAKEARLVLEDAAVQAARSKYRVELDWMRRQPQARQSKSKARIDAFYKLETSTKPRPRDPSLNLVETSAGDERRIGGKIVSMRNVCLTFGDGGGWAGGGGSGSGAGNPRVMLDDFSYDFCRGDRICLAGANGVGKTTFTKLITGELAPSSGEVEIGDTVVLGCYDQLGLKFDETAESQTVMEFVSDQVQAYDSTEMATSPAEARNLLNQFEFSRSRWNERVSVLSGGERRRLQMLSVLSKKPNFLILDEPSVDCDLDTISALENYLEQFQGVLLVVSHDRAFADKVTDHLFVFEGGGVVKDFQGSLSEYASCLVEIENQKIQETMAGSAEGSGSDINKQANYKEDRARRNEARNVVRRAKKEMQNIERELERLKAQAEKVQSDLDATSSDDGWTLLAELTDELNALNDQIEEKELRWLEVGEELEYIQEGED